MCLASQAFKISNWSKMLGVFWQFWHKYKCSKMALLLSVWLWSDTLLNKCRQVSLVREELQIQTFGACAGSVGLLSATSAEGWWLIVRVRILPVATCSSFNGLAAKADLPSDYLQGRDKRRSDSFSNTHSSKGRVRGIVIVRLVFRCDLLRVSLWSTICPCFAGLSHFRKDLREQRA